MEICCVLLFYLFFCLCILLAAKWRAYIWKLPVTLLFLLFLLMKTLCLGFTDFCIVLKTKERSQVPLLLEYLPPWFWIYHYYSWHRQFVQGLWHFAACKEMEICLHYCAHCVGCDFLVVGSNYLVCSFEEEIQQVHQAPWRIQQWRRQAIGTLLRINLLLRFSHTGFWVCNILVSFLKILAHLCSFPISIGLCKMAWFL